MGAGKQAAQVLSLMKWMGLAWHELVLFDDAYPTLREGPWGRPVLGTLAEGIDYCILHSLPAMVALGSRNAVVRYSVFSKLLLAGVVMPNLVHFACQIAPSVVLGQNVVIMPGAVLSWEVSIGSLCWFYTNVTLEHDTQVGDNVVIGPGVVTSGYVKIGKHAFLGTGVVCAPEVSIGERALIGSGAVVISDIPAGMIAYGVPARVHRQASPGMDVPMLADLENLGA